MTEKTVNDFLDMLPDIEVDEKEGKDGGKSVNRWFYIILAVVCLLGIVLWMFL